MVFLHTTHDLGPSRFIGDIWYQQRLLGLPDQTGRSFINRLLMSADQIGRHIRLNGVQPHHLLDWVIQGEPDEVDPHYTGKALRDLPKELVKVSVSGNGLRDFQQRNAAAAGPMLARLKQTVIDNGNVFAVLMDAVRVCSLGQISSALYEVGGQYRRSM